MEFHLALRPDAFSDWSEKKHMSDLVKENAAGMMRYWYERAVDEQKTELREYKKKAKAHHPPVEPVPLTIEEDLSQDQREEARPIEA